jgi:predicted regulator of Ras-like GTPase activity (Roadblock/LC7/MglB family)
MNQLNNTNRTGNVQLSRSQFENVSECLAYLAKKLRLTALILVNSSGQVCAKKSSPDWQADTTLLATLTANSFAATTEIARLLGEKTRFRMVLHEGENQNVYVSSVTSEYFLIVIFEKDVALGMVRLFTKRTIDQLLPVLKQNDKSNTRMDQIFSKQFQSLLDEELDQSLKEKT